MIWILRHGEAARPAGVRDADRPLTELGKHQSAVAGRALRDRAPRVAAVLTSPKLRARETAELAVAAHGKAPEPIVFHELDGERDLSPADLKVLMAPWSLEDVLIVGHNPVLGQLLHDFTGAKIKLPVGTLAAVAASKPNRLGVLLPPIPPNGE